MIRRISFFFAIAATLVAPSFADTPVRYDAEATVKSLPKSGREPFGSKFFFASAGLVIYRVLPAERSDTDPATQWDFWSPSGTDTLNPVTGYESLEVVGLNSRGEAIGRSVAESFPGPNPHQEAALYWTRSDGSITPPGFDPGSSGLKALNALGDAVGFTDSGAYKFVLWNVGAPNAQTTITPPAGYPYTEIHGVSASGETLLYVTDNDARPRLAIWDGTTSTVVGPALDAGEKFSPANCAINGHGDAVMLVFVPGGNYRIIYIPAADRANYQIFTFTGPVSDVYNLGISDAGLACGQTSENTVSIVSSSRAQQYSFAGFRPFLNASGEFIFGAQDKLYYWDAAAWTGSPVAVPLSLPAAPAAPTIVGFNDDGRLLALSDNSAQTLRTLSILAPYPPTHSPTPMPVPPAKITLVPVQKTLVVTTRTTLRKRALVKTHHTGQSAGTVRFVLRGVLPKGLRFVPSNGSLTGRPTQAQERTVRVAAAYSSDGKKTQSPSVAIKVLVREPSSRRRR